LICCLINQKKYLEALRLSEQLLECIEKLILEKRANKELWKKSKIKDMKLLLNAYLNYGLSIILCSAKEAKTARYSPTEVFQRGSVLAEKYFKGSAIEARLLKLKQEAAQ